MNYNKIKEILTSKGISIPQLAEKIGMSKAGIYLAIDKKRMSIDTIEKIAEALEVPITVFFDEDHITNSKAEMELSEMIKEYGKKIGELEIINRNKNVFLNLIYQNMKSNLRYYEMLLDNPPPASKEIFENKTVRVILANITSEYEYLIGSIAIYENFSSDETNNRELNETIKPDTESKKDVFVSVSVVDNKQLKNKAKQVK